MRSAVASLLLDSAVPQSGLLNLAWDLGWNLHCIDKWSPDQFAETRQNSRDN